MSVKSTFGQDMRFRQSGHGRIMVVKKTGFARCIRKASVDLHSIERATGRNSALVASNIQEKLSVK